MIMPVTPTNPARFTERMPTRVTHSIEQATGRGVDAAVTEARLYGGDLSVKACEHAFLDAVRAARHGDRLTVLGVRIGVT